MKIAKTLLRYEYVRAATCAVSANLTRELRESVVQQIYKASGEKLRASMLHSAVLATGNAIHQSAASDAVVSALQILNVCIATDLVWSLKC